MQHKKNASSPTLEQFISGTGFHLNGELTVTKCTQVNRAVTCHKSWREKSCGNVRFTICLLSRLRVCEPLLKGSSDRWQGRSFNGIWAADVCETWGVSLRMNCQQGVPLLQWAWERGQILADVWHRRSLDWGYTPDFPRPCLCVGVVSVHVCLEVFATLVLVASVVT